MSLDPQSLGSLFEMSRDAILGIRDGKILFLNPAASGLFGAAPGDDAGKFLPDYILSDPAEHFFATMTLYGLSCQVTITREGELTLACVVLPQETPIPPYLNRALRELSGSLLSAKLAMDILINKTNAEADPKLRDYTGALYKNYYSMKRMCNHITVASALKNGTHPFRPKPVSLDQLFRDICNTAAYFTSELGIQLIFTAENADCQTMADPGLLELMLLNLLSNSIAHCSEDSVIEVKLERHNDRFILSINDQGSGISAGKLPYIYKAGSTDETDDGAGLGLSIARGIAEQHNGALILESREGKGTKLRISLPVDAPTDLVFHEPPVAYEANGLDSYLTEFSVILDKKFYNKTLFD